MILRIGIIARDISFSRNSKTPRKDERIGSSARQNEGAAQPNPVCSILHTKYLHIAIPRANSEPNLDEVILLFHLVD